MLEALTQLGCRIEGDGDGARSSPASAAAAADAAVDLFLGNAGTAMRPLAAALALGAAAGGASSCAASPRMHERPIGDLVDALRALGCAIDYLGSRGLSAARVHPRAGAARRSTRRSACAATSRASS